MQTIAHMITSVKKLHPAKQVMLGLSLTAVLFVLCSFLFVPEPVFFLKWFFGLQADD